MVEESSEFIDRLKSMLSGAKGSVRILSPSETTEVLESQLSNVTDFLLLKIFHFLPIKSRLSLRCVCWKWYQLLFDFSIWQKINLGDDLELLSSGRCFEFFTEWIFYFGARVQEVDVGGVAWVDDRMVVLIAQNCPNLKRLDLKACFKVTDASLKEVARYCTNLECINLYCTATTENGFEELVRRCRNISGVCIGNQGNCCSMLLTICDFKRGLVRLAVHDTIPTGTWHENVRDSVIQQVSWVCFDLQCIHLTWCFFITDESLKSIANQCKCLKTFRIRECQQVTDQGLKEILLSCSMLRTLEIERLYQVSDLTNQSMNRAENLPNLQSLKITDTRMNDETLTKLTERCPNLRSLVFGEFYYQPMNLTGQCMSHIVAHCKKLKWLSVLVRRVHDSDLFAIATHSHELIGLELGDCGGCSDRGVSSLSRGCPYLMKLVLKGCDDIRERMRIKIRRRLQYLTTFDVQ
ncbi:F-box/LRR-repeat protein 7 [Nematostella vectensis]|uniref:F-box/LRR-repeat protein 7 n=1 Tax=Nematostella vectensis TaxID=45351 RepID=UPI002077996C|nr:F-box/LRR-repeat protein 7 [Nematostella vectensis]